MIYNPSLDGIRAVAVVAVLGFHTTLPVFKGGFVGVDVFFVLSGFLITSILREELRLSGSIRLRRFYMRRLARLMPPLAASLVAVYVGYSLLFPDLDIGPDVIFGLLYLSDYGVPLFGAPRYITHTWSLSVEEHFYIVWPVLLIATCRLSGRLLFVLLALAYAAATAWRFADAILWDDFIRTYYRFDTRLSGMILGGLLALRPLELKAETVRAIGLYSLVALAMLVLGLRWKFIPSLLIGGLAAELAAAGLIISATSRHETPVSKALSHPWVVYLGVLSYSIYLWHYGIVFVLREIIHPVPTFLITLGVSVAIAAVSHRFMERPLRDWANRRLSGGRGEVREALPASP